MDREFEYKISARWAYGAFDRRALAQIQAQIIAHYTLDDRKPIALLLTENPRHEHPR